MKLLWNSKEWNYIQQDYVISATVFILTVCTLTSFADIVRDELWFDADFSVVNNGRNIDEVVMHVDDVDFAQCTMYCVQHLKCKSVNYNENERMCELCDSEYFEGDAIVDGVTGWKNYGTPPKQDGGYSDWIYGVCSVTCGYGEQIRYRRCNSPPPRYGGADCQGPYLESICCKVKECPVHGGYSTWSTFGNCSRWCGGGVQKRNRSCSNPPPSLGGENCSLLGDDTETRSCNEEPCQGVNFALHKPCSQSSTHQTLNNVPNDAFYANDGNVMTRSATNHGIQWWSVDLQKSTKINHILLYFYNHALANNFYRDMQIDTRLYETDTWSLCTTLESPMTMSITAICDERRMARFVKVTNTKMLYLAEVEIYGIDSCVEYDVEYQGIDIKMLQSVRSWLQCSQYCTHVTKCSQWIWDKKARTCYLKEGSIERKVMKLDIISGLKRCTTIGRAVSGLNFFEFGRHRIPKSRMFEYLDTCIEVDTMYKGNDIHDVSNVVSWEYCSYLCRKLNMCTHWTWNNLTGDTNHLRCVLKNSDSGRKRTQGKISGRKECGLEYGTNFALNKIALLSSIDGSNDAYLALDGDLSTRAVTQSDLASWFYVDLLQSVQIHRIDIFIDDSFVTAQGNHSFEVFTSVFGRNIWKLCKDIGKAKELMPNKVVCENNTTARFVNITTSSQQRLSIWEFMVFGKPTDHEQFFIYSSGKTYSKYRIDIIEDGGIEKGKIVENQGMLFRIIKPGINESVDSISLESVSRKGFYLASCKQITSGTCWVSLRQYSTEYDFIWYIRSDKFVAGTVAFESGKHSSYFMRHQGFLLKLSTNDQSDNMFKQDASFQFGSGDGYLSNPDGKAYKLHTDALTWNDSKSKCENDHAQLAVVNSEAIHNYLKERYPTVRMWIGGTDEKYEGKWSWVDGSLMISGSQYWNNYEPNGNRRENCLLSIGVDGLWNDVLCLDTHQFLCQRGKDDVYIPAPDGRAYKFYQQELKWDEAKKICEGDNATLTSVDDAVTQDFLIRKFGTMPSFWLGANDIDVEGKWVWADGRPIKTAYWHPGQPNNIQKADCVRTNFVNPGEWNDARCGVERPFLCQKSGLRYSFFTIETRPVKGSLLFTIPTLRKEYEVSLEVYITGFLPGWTNVMQMTLGEHNSKYGDRSPAIYLHTIRMLVVSIAVNGEKSHDYEKHNVDLHNWMKISNKQFILNGEHVNTVSINDKEVLRVTNSDPREFKNMKVYASNPWNAAAAAKIRNLVIVNG